ncbi:MAG: hypothetical protein Q8K75_03375 [Chlamydiales bacterium]|nr:hypothetical protein [Chlamydiales bacterium]
MNFGEIGNSSPVRQSLPVDQAQAADITTQNRYVLPIAAPCVDSVDNRVVLDISQSNVLSSIENLVTQQGALRLDSPQADDVTMQPLPSLSFADELEKQLLQETSTSVDQDIEEIMAHRKQESPISLEVSKLEFKRKRTSIGANRLNSLEKELREHPNTYSETIRRLGLQWRIKKSEVISQLAEFRKLRDPKIDTLLKDLSLRLEHDRLVEFQILLGKYPNESKAEIRGLLSHTFQVPHRHVCSLLQKWKEECSNTHIQDLIMQYSSRR